MKKLQLPECFMCFVTRTDRYGFGGELCKKQKLPRKKKKQLKQFWHLMDGREYRYFMDHPSSCSLGDEYKRAKPLFHLIPVFTKRSAALEKIWQYCEEAGEGIYFDDKGRLSWHWESDDDYTGGSSGVMAFCYNEKDAGRTWAFSEVQQLVKWLLDYPEEFTFPAEILSDRTLIEWVHRTFISDVLFHKCEACERYTDYNAMVHAEQSFCIPCYDELSKSPDLFPPPECEQCGYGYDQHADDCPAAAIDSHLTSK